MAFTSARCPSSSRFAPLPTTQKATACSQSLHRIPKIVFRKWVCADSHKNRKWNVVRMQDATATVPVPSAKVPVPSAKVPQVNMKVENGPLTTLPSDKYQNVPVLDSATEPTVSITIVGASGDLAKKKIFPALFALYYEDCLPKHFTIFGYARSKMTDAELRNMVSRTLTCRIDKRENCNDKMDAILRRCFYHSGQYDSEENFAELDKKLKEHEVFVTHMLTTKSPSNKQKTRWT